MNTITLATLHEATAQQVFDQGARHLLTQGRKSLDESGDCAYRGEGGLKCVAGCFIADYEYNPRWENRSWHTLVDHQCVPSAHELLINALQLVHDDTQPDEWRHELYRAALRENLSPAVLTEFAEFAP